MWWRATQRETWRMTTKTDVSHDAGHKIRYCEGWKRSKRHNSANMAWSLFFYAWHVSNLIPHDVDADLDSLHILIEPSVAEMQYYGELWTIWSVHYPHYDIFGSLIGCFLNDTQHVPPPNLDEVPWPNAKQLAELSIADDFPRDILPRANDLWRITRSGECFGNSYKSINPMTFANQKNG